MPEKQKLVIPFAIILFFFLSLFSYIKLAGPIPFSISSRVTNEVDSFWVQGEGKVAVKPDTAYLLVGLRANDATVAQVQTQMNQVMNEVTQRLKQAGINVDKDVKTDGYSINPIIDWQEKGMNILGYDAYVSLKITIRDIDQVNLVIDEAVAGGANTVNNVSFDVDDREMFIDQARKEAVAQAKERAQQAASTAGFKLGKLISYYESFEDDYKEAYSERDFSALSISEPVPMVTEILPGTSEIKITVSMTYAIE